MDMTTAFKKGIDNITNFEGRAGRSEFWYFVLVIYIVAFGVGVVLLILAAILPDWLSAIVSLLMFVLYIAATVGVLSAGVRRLHDVGQPGWMVIFAFLGCLWLIPLYFWVQPSQGDNQYGPASA
jgi:uncharacterized membrane protein YhaH (DUF805 family)